MALDEVDVSLGGKERLGLIGPNGSGKTTLINCISGALFNEQGKVNFEGNDVTGTAASNRAKLGIVRTFQIPRPFRSMTIVENLEIPMKFGYLNIHVIIINENNTKLIIDDIIGLTIVNSACY